MATATQPYNIQRRTSITVPHQGSNLTLTYPCFGPSTYSKVQSEIEQQGLSTTSLAELVSFLHPAYLNNEPEFQGIRNRDVWAFTGFLWIPDKGVYVQDHPEIRNEMPYMEESDLIRRLESSDPSVRFVPFGFKTGLMTPEEFRNNAYARAAMGEEGADKFAEFTRKTRRTPSLWTPSIPRTTLISVAGFGAGSGWSLFDGSGVLHDSSASCGVAKLPASAEPDISEASTKRTSKLSSKIEARITEAVRQGPVLIDSSKNVAYIKLPQYLELTPEEAERIRSAK